MGKTRQRTRWRDLRCYRRNQEMERITEDNWSFNWRVRSKNCWTDNKGRCCEWRPFPFKQRAEGYRGKVPEASQILPRHCISVNLGCPRGWHYKTFKSLMLSCSLYYIIDSRQGRKQKLNNLMRFFIICGTYGWCFWWCRTFPVWKLLYRD